MKNKYQIDQKKCISCGTCDMECPFHAILISEIGKFSIDQEVCRGCGICLSVCPLDAPYKQEKEEQ